MEFSIRALDEADFPACTAMLRGLLAYPDSLIEVLPACWQRLLADHAMHAVVFEGLDRSRRRRRIGFAATVFITDGWVAAAKAGAEPYLSMRTVLADLEGDESPILRPDGIASANAGAGLNVLNLHYCEAPDLAAEQRLSLCFHAAQAYLQHCRGYRIKELIQELWDEIAPEFVLRGWGCIRSDYAGYFAARGQPAPPSGRCPYLVGLTREEALANPRDAMAPVFLYQPPRFAFSPAEKQLLRQALHGSSDVELSEALGLALPTVKSHWRAIYDRVARVEPELLPAPPLETALGAVRGQEKRRRLIDYLRRHSEELCAGLDERRRGPTNDAERRQRPPLRGPSDG